MAIFSTNRLTLREATPADAPFFLELMNEPGWLNYIAQHDVQTHAKATEYTKTKIMPAYAENRFGLWLVELKETHQPIGICGFVSRDSLPNVDLGFAFLEAFGQQGYAFEAAGGSLNFARLNLKDDNISAIVLPENNRSVRLLEKLGFQLRSDFYHPGSDEKLHLYSIKNS